MAGCKTADDFVMADRGQGHGGNAAALRTIGIAAELAGSDAGGEIGGDGAGGAGEDAVLRTGRRGERCGD